MSIINQTHFRTKVKCSKLKRNSWAVITQHYLWTWQLTAMDITADMCSYA